MTQKKCGIFGGTFDPVHKGHLEIARQAIKQCHLDRCILVPNRIPPHRDIPHASAEQRVAMLQLAIADYPELEVSTCELDRDGPSYMIDTVNYLDAGSGAGMTNDRHPAQNDCHPGLDPESRKNTKPVLIIGADSFNSFDQWHQWQAILTKVQVAVFQRPHHPIKQTSVVSDYIQQHHLPNIQLINSAIDLCSTNLRVKLNQKDKILADEIPQKVLEYIQVHGLYGTTC
ncbi:MAG: nicotinate (nicotinamide) nucleotide adenylyltransferase [Coxiellaceae bacterium]|nr:nicotinate (nicotinamide) nucleotide adenylyltransferase [Coxiellaceae bacterium]